MDNSTFFLIFSPAWLLISFLLYWPFFFKYQKEGLSRKILSLRYYGAVLFGGIPLLVSSLAGFSLLESFGLSFVISTNPLIWLISLILGLVIVGISYFSSRNEKSLLEFPQIRDKNWSIGLVYHNIFTWIIYLIGYELLFRGIMLFPLVPVLGFWPVAVIGTVLYSLSHYPKSLREALGAIPFGLLLAWIAWQTQSVWPCIWIHACLAVSSSLFSLYHHPDIHLRKPSLKSAK